MRGLFIHTVVFAVINTLLVGVWLFTTGSTDELSLVQKDPLFHAQHGFWPLIVAAVWAGGLVIHAAVVVTALLPSSKRKARRAKQREMMAKAVKRDRDRRRERERERAARHGTAKA